MAAFVDITHRVATEARLAAFSHDLQDLYDHAPCGYHSLDAEGRYLRINDTELAWLGYTREEVNGKMRPTDFFTPEGKEQFARCFPAFLIDGEIHDIEYDLVCRDRPSRRVSINATAATDEQGRFVMSRGIMYDVTDLHQSREQLRQMALEQQAMLDNDVIGIVKLRDRQAVWTNRALGRIFGYESNELLGQPSRILYIDDESYGALGAAAYPVLRSGGQFRQQLEMVRKDGARIWIDMSGVLLLAAGDESMWLLDDITPAKKYQAQIERMAHTDGLTGLPNRRLLAERMSQALALARRQGYRTAVCYVDLDGFKQVHDQFGHASGDHLLAEIGRRLPGLLRGHDTAARLGDDEFVLLLTQLGDEEECLAILRCVLVQIAAPILLDGGKMAQVSASIGVAQAPIDGVLPEELLRRADAAMYEAKRLGRNQFCRYHCA